MTKLTCHCTGVEIEVLLPDGLKNLIRCNCSICKKGGAVMAVVCTNDLKVILDQLDLSNAGIHGDTFHMAIDEKNIAEAYRKTGSKLNHTHMADSNRAAPGQGHTDFLPILQALKDINFSGYLTMELIPAVSDPFACIRGGKAEEFKDKYTELSIKHLKDIESKLK